MRIIHLCVLLHLETRLEDKILAENIWLPFVPKVVEFIYFLSLLQETVNKYE